MAAGIGGVGPAMAAREKVPFPRPRPAVLGRLVAAPVAPAARSVPLPEKRPPQDINAAAQASAGLHGALFAGSATIKPMARPVSGPFAVALTPSTSAADIAAVKQVIEFARKGKDGDADAAERSIGDPLARKLAEWVILRSDNTKPTFERYAAFVNANPSWPHAALFRRRAENALWNDRLDDATVLAYFGSQTPITAKGHYMLARALLDRGDRAGAEALVREAWREQDCSADVESKVIEMFGGMLTPADHKSRMEHRFYADDAAAGLRAAERLGGNDLAIGRAWAAVTNRAGNAKALLEAVPPAARHGADFIFAQVEWLLKNDKIEDATKWMLTAPRDAAELVDLDQWWLQRRILVRKLLDAQDPQTAYRIARDAPAPVRGNYKVDQHFTAGWLALRFLHDPATAAAHFAQIAQGTVNPHALARAGYWQGRAAEAMGHHAEAKAFYEAAAMHSVTYYGQLARARLGLPDLGLRGPPNLAAGERATLSRLEVVRAVEILYALNERDLVAPIYAELGESGTDVAGLTALGEIAGAHGDGRAMVLLGQSAVGRGLPLDYYAFPVAGLPDYRPITAPIEPAVAYSIARQESHFNQKIVSSAHAMGLMQVTPDSAQDSAKRYKVTYDRARLLSDPVYNMQMGAAELSMLINSYNGSYIMTFAGYNAGRGRVRQWVAAYGDPRDPKIDPVDWVERIPIAETRNYVERIMENLQVYRARFGGGSKLLIEADLRRGAAN
ncbi:MAG TPA: lytic transglycosylase domain-containing protein [Pseudolabrys sp.]|nr:lytic transglycosylase domain-containing protein [Pseudolabrys sp.]